MGAPWAAWKPKSTCPGTPGASRKANNFELGKLLVRRDPLPAIRPGAPVMPAGRIRQKEPGATVIAKPSARVVTAAAPAPSPGFDSAKLVVLSKPGDREGAAAVTTCAGGRMVAVTPRFPLIGWACRQYRDSWALRVLAVVRPA